MFISILSISAEVVPVRGLLYGPDDIVMAREGIKTSPLVQSIADEFIRNADKWIARGWDGIEKLIPPEDAVYAYGFAGDPKVNKPWSWWGRDGEASLDRPFTVRSPYTGDLYGLQKPGEEFYDDGKGWVRPSDKKTFYFKGVWNSHVIRSLHEAIDQLSMAYLLTGEEKYGRLCLRIFDRLATLRSHRSQVDGPIDWPHSFGPGYGFFNYAGNVGNDRMVASALAFDLVGGMADAKEASPTRPGLTLFENVRTNYFSVFEKWYIEKRSSLQNHAVAALAASLSQAVLFGYPDQIREGIDGAFGFLDSTVDRDGEYYELSSTYVYLGRIYGARLLQPLERYSPDNYATPSAFPQPADYPNGLRFAEDPIWFNTVVPSLYRLTTIGRQPQYGDAPPDRYTAVKTATTTSENILSSLFPRQKVIYLKMFYHATANPEWKELCARLYWEIPEAVRHSRKYLREGILEFGPSQWGDLPRPATDAPLPDELTGKKSTIVGQKRIAILRAGDGADQRALFIRGGSPGSHAHSDQMGIVLYSHGLSLTGEYGYKLYGTPDHRGWGAQPVAHQLVVVNEGLDDPIPAAGHPPTILAPAARITGYIPDGPARLIEMTNPQAWPGAKLSDYRRQSWMIDLPGGAEGYFLDIFWVDGGRTHDYTWSAPFVNRPQAEPLHIEGAEPEAVPGVWSLAALGNPRYRQATFNRKGQSWGERLDVGSGTIRSIGIKGESLASSDWNPDPGNGYGFIWNVKAAEVKAGHDWEATWLLHDERHSMKLSVFNPDGQTLIRGKTPTLTADRSQDILIIRRKSDGGKPLNSRFVTVSQVTDQGGEWPVKRTQWLQGAAAGQVAIALALADGGTDIVLSASHEGAVRTPQAWLEGRRGLVRRDAEGKLCTVVLSEGTRLSGGDFEVRLSRPAWTGRVVDIGPASVELDAALPSQATLARQGITFMSPSGAAHSYSSSEYFNIEDLTPTARGTMLSFKWQKLVMSRIKIDQRLDNGTYKTYWPNEVSLVPVKKEDKNRLFEGHRIVSEADPARSSVVTDYPTKESLKVESGDLLKQGRFYQIYATQPGDTWRIPSSLVLERADGDAWRIRANMDAKVRLPGAKRTWLLSSGKRPPLTLEADADGLISIRVDQLPDGDARLVPSGE